MFEKKEKNRNLPAGTWEIFIRGRVEGWISCIYVVAVCLRVVHISPSLLSFFEKLENDAQRIFAMKFCILQGGQKAGGG